MSQEIGDDFWQKRQEPRKTTIILAECDVTSDSLGPLASGNLSAAAIWLGRAVQLAVSGYAVVTSVTA